MGHGLKELGIEKFCNKSILEDSEQTKPKCSCQNQKVAETGILVSVSILAAFQATWF